MLGSRGEERDALSAISTSVVMPAAAHVKEETRARTSLADFGRPDRCRVTL